MLENEEKTKRSSKDQGKIDKSKHAAIDIDVGKTQWRFRGGMLLAAVR